jgi:hypothetical protein
LSIDRDDRKVFSDVKIHMKSNDERRGSSIISKAEPYNRPSNAVIDVDDLLFYQFEFFEIHKWPLHSERGLCALLCGVSGNPGGSVRATQVLELAEGNARQNGSEKDKEERPYRNGIARRPLPEGFFWLLLGGALLGLGIGAVVCRLIERAPD